MKIRTIDLWTEQYKNQYECFNGAFIDGFENSKIPFDRYKILKNCNCIIEVNRRDINIGNKHNAIIFYDNDMPVRLAVLNRETDIEKCVNIALNQNFNNTILKEVYENQKIEQVVIDMKEAPILNSSNNLSEIDVGSCDRWKLLYSMLKGSYTEDSTPYGNYQCDKYEFIPNIKITYKLKTDEEEFEIEHQCAFINEIKTRIIPIQEHSKLTK